MRSFIHLAEMRAKQRFFVPSACLAASSFLLSFFFFFLFLFPSSRDEANIASETSKLACLLTSRRVNIGNGKPEDAREYESRDAKRF